MSLLLLCFVFCFEFSFFFAIRNEGMYPSEESQSYISRQFGHKNATTFDEVFHMNVITMLLRFFTFSGQVELNLNRMPKPAKSARRCSLLQLPSFEEGRSSSSVESVSLFEMKRVYGWWPCVAQEAGEEMQLTVRSKCKFS